MSVMVAYLHDSKNRESCWSGKEPALRRCRGGRLGIEPVFARVFDESTNFQKPLGENGHRGRADWVQCRQKKMIADRSV